MSGGRLAVLVLIFVLVSVGWAILSGSMFARTQQSEASLRPKVEGLWGGPQEQNAPTAQAKWTETVRVWDEKKQRGLEKEQSLSQDLALSSSRIRADLGMDFRRKGLLWYSTYEVTFDGQYTLVNPAAQPRTVVVTFRFPSPSAIYDDFEFSVAGQRATAVGATEQGVPLKVTAAPGQMLPVKVHYRSRGLGTWKYSFGPQTSQVNNCTITVTTDFARVDFPGQTMSPTDKMWTGRGWQLKWEFKSLVTGLGIGIEMPTKLDPGPWAMRVSAFAPIGLLFFLSVLVIVGVVNGVNPHPMHYLFVCSAFFAFHLLLSYLVDHMDTNGAFAIAAAVSVFLVLTYLIRAMGLRFTLTVALPAQLIFLVLFSYSFFYPGYTGLAITIGAVVTLFALMQITAKVNWEGRLASTRQHPPQPPPQGGVGSG
jgi:inner membrane protein involved in colicin E2 resistance